MNYKVGQELYCAHIDDETLRIDFTKYRVRTIRGGYVYAILLDTFTWGGNFQENIEIPDGCLISQLSVGKK